MKIAVFASGNGSNFQAIAEQLKESEIEIAFLFSDHKDAFVLERAKKLQIPEFSFELKEFSSKAEYEKKILSLLQDYEVDFVVLAGYMKIVHGTLLDAYQDRILNIHPAYLPEFPGAHGIEDAFLSGAKESGVTVHLVDSGIDTGGILKQTRVPIKKDDTLETFENRIHAVEHELYPGVIVDFGKLLVRD
ncbi:MAG: phosphoribosylglycinamide formyltransferase [Streptococcaceae bacterium]|jgi:phosphoribosylglycinamide formyltransferase-1|nr:phosphoribosylglycinamide formyltransferase [Streptococcaceae bacterium]